MACDRHPSPYDGPPLLAQGAEAHGVTFARWIWLQDLAPSLPRDQPEGNGSSRGANWGWHRLQGGICGAVPLQPPRIDPSQWLLSPSAG